MQKEFKFLEKLVLSLSVLALSACISLRPMPKITRCLSNPAKGQLDCINEQGTEFHFKFTDKNEDKTYQFDKWVCAPGAQVIDFAAWLQELLVVVKQGAK
jgi:hypothetical protein